MVVTTGYPGTAHRINYIHNLFQNGGATLSGLVEMYHERVRRGEIPESKDIKFVMVTDDGGMDIGMGAALGSLFHRRMQEIPAVDGLTFDLASGEIVGFLGPNGAGKTTT